ncbi:Hypothetical predicted protein [Podarcis lilfordi]|uniref:Uncharacterized protein n=1 Tax=Podarcis lilfordi TaxID=74358 RepID=A0AA35KHS2_9SAUR|nr:Hypothetical predicted protein [Podarcis lilfordi]
MHRGGGGGGGRLRRGGGGSHVQFEALLLCAFFNKVTFSAYVKLLRSPQIALPFNEACYKWHCFLMQQ